MEYVIEYDPLKKRINQYRIEVGEGRTWLESISRETLEMDFKTDYHVSYVAENIYNALEKSARSLEENKTPLKITLRLGVSQEVSDQFRKKHNIPKVIEDWIPSDIREVIEK
ncbi:MAG: hypothetical protein WC584_05385 [Candidatus Pacearchaeota archaeon]